MLHTTEHIKHLKDWPVELIPLRLSGKQNGNFERWYNAYDSLPDLNVTNVFFGDTVTIEGETRDEQSLVDGLKGLLPWRKGPFRFANVLVDTEWRSDLKWSRVMSSKAIRQALEGASVLDVGCGNGYFGWRMLKAGPERHWHRSFRAVLSATPMRRALCPRQKKYSSALQAGGTSNNRSIRLRF